MIKLIFILSFVGLYGCSGEIDCMDEGNVPPEYEKACGVVRMNVMREIKRVEKTGFSDAIDETAIGLRDLVVPVTWPVVGMSAALASTFLYGGLKERHIERRRMALHHCSEKISKNLGIGE